MQLLAAALFWICRWFCKRIKKLHEGWMFLLPFAFFVLAVWSAMFWPIFGSDLTIASGLATVFSWVFDLVAAGLGGTGGIIASLVLILLLLGSVADLWDQKPDRWVKFSVFLIAPITLVASAEFAPWLLGFVEHISGVGPQVLTAIA